MWQKKQNDLRLGLRDWSRYFKCHSNLNTIHNISTHLLYIYVYQFENWFLRLRFKRWYEGFRCFSSKPLFLNGGSIPFKRTVPFNSYLLMTIKEMPTEHSNHVHNFCKEEITRPTDLFKMKIKLCQTFLCKSFCNIFCKHCQEHLDRITAGGWGWGVYQKLQIL